MRVIFRISLVECLCFNASHFLPCFQSFSWSSALWADVIVFLLGPVVFWAGISRSLNSSTGYYYCQEIEELPAARMHWWLPWLPAWHPAQRNNSAHGQGQGQGRKQRTLKAAVYSWHGADRRSPYLPNDCNTDYKWIFCLRSIAVLQWKQHQH